MANYYNTGTVSASGGSTTITGAGTLWSLVQPGDTLVLAGQWAVVASVTDTTHLELAAPWGGADQSGASYTIRYDAPTRFAGYTIATRQREVLDRLGILDVSRPNYEVQSLGSNTPPGSPVELDMYVVGTSPTGAWAGQANKLAQWTGSGWLFTVPGRNTSVISAATGTMSIWNGTSWLAYVAPSAFIQTLMDDADAAAARATLGGTAFRALGTLTGAAGSFPRFTGAGASDAVMQAIVGTVTQSGGVPTGGIIEWGSNANGVYVKYADRTMICWQRAFRTIGVVPATNFVNLGALTFPAEFASSPSVFCTYEGAWSVYLIAAIQTVSATGIAAAYISNFSSAGRDAGNNYFYYTAIGRWF